MKLSSSYYFRLEFLTWDANCNYTRPVTQIKREMDSASVCKFVILKVGAASKTGLDPKCYEVGEILT